MFYCMINNTNFNNNKININYCLINDPLEIKITKKFNMDINIDDNIYRIRFSQNQLKDNNIENYTKEILDDFTKSKYIFGKKPFEEYFYKIEDYENLYKINDILKYKYIKINDILDKLQEIKKFKYIL